MESLIGKKFPVLNHGHIVLVDVMGDDQAIVDAARTCYQKGTTHTSDNRTLLRYLMRHRHTSPFEACQIKFHIKLPIFVERQWARHRTAGWNEVSARYSELPEEIYLPDPSEVCAQSTTNRQGRGDTFPPERAEAFVEDTAALGKAAFEQYHDNLEEGMARELARINLPLGTYTEKVWWISLHNILHFLGLRMDSHAQAEIRAYATIIGEQIIKPLFPMVWEAFEDYRLGGMFLTAIEQRVLTDAVACHGMGDIQLFTKGSRSRMQSHLLTMSWHSIPQEWKQERCRERDEFLQKMVRMGLLQD